MKDCLYHIALSTALLATLLCPCMGAQRSALLLPKTRVSTPRGLKRKPKSSKSTKDKECRSDLESWAIFDALINSPRSRVDDFLDGNGNAIEGLEFFIDQVINFVGDNDVTEPLTDREILLAAMAPDENSVDLIEGRYLEEDCLIVGRCVALSITVLEQSFDLLFSLVGLNGPFGGAGKVVGKKLAASLLKSSNARRIVRKLAELVEASGSDIVFAATEAVKTVLADVGLENIMRAFRDEKSISFVEYLSIVSNFFANLAAVLAGFGTVAKVAQAFLSAKKLWDAMLGMKRCRDECVNEREPSMLPTSVREPSQEPTPEPTPDPTPEPTRAPTPEPTPDDDSSQTPAPTRPTGRITGVFGDPHLSTFDRFRFDCQAGGEFITVTSLQTPGFMIQERFTSVDSNACSQASVSTGVVVQDEGLPRVQVSTPRGDADNGASLNDLNGCPLDFYVDGTARAFSDDLSSFDVDVSVSSLITILYPTSNIELIIRVRSSEAFGCFLTVQVFVPNAYRSDETLFGLLGTPNGNRFDEWRDRNGNIIQSPIVEDVSIFSQSYQYCVDNWCTKSENESIFTYGEGESFDLINDCSVDYADDIEAAVANSSPELVAICGTDIFCLVDGACGNLDDAVLALQDEQLIVGAQEALNPEPSSFPILSIAPSAQPSFVPSVVDDSGGLIEPSVGPSSFPRVSKSSKKAKKTKPKREIVI